MNEDLARAIRTESAVALKFWFRVAAHAVWNWRQAFGVSGRDTTPGSARELYGVVLKGAAAVKAKDWTDEECDRKAELAKQCGTRPGPRWTRETGAWTKQQLQLLGTDDDEVIAKRIGKTANAVRVKRLRLKIPVFRDRRWRTNS